MQTMTRAMVVGVVALGLTAGAAQATDEPPSISQSGKGKARVKTGTVARFVMKRTQSMSLDLPNVPDNDPTVEGGNLMFYEIGNAGNNDTYALQASGWSKLGPDALNPSGFLYRGAGTPGDPCRFVKVTSTTVKGLCLGSDVTLNPPLSSFFLGVTLTVGSSSKLYCPAYYAIMNEPGRLRGTAAIHGDDLVCSPSGAFLDTN